VVTPLATPEGTFTATAAGPAGGPLVLLLHGYPQTRHTWRHQVPALGAAGYRAVAPDQRGYSPGVRPDPAKGLDAYAIDRLVQDVLDPWPTRPPGPGGGSTWSATTGAGTWGGSPLTGIPRGSAR
jgi:pimeloyl-ACP methyl ester carboxylesterase